MAHKERETINSFYGVLLDYGQPVVASVQPQPQPPSPSPSPVASDPFDLIVSINLWPTCNCFLLLLYTYTPSLSLLLSRIEFQLNLVGKALSSFTKSANNSSSIKLWLTNHLENQCRTRPNINKTPRSGQKQTVLHLSEMHSLGTRIMSKCTHIPEILLHDMNCTRTYRNRFGNLQFRGKLSGSLCLVLLLLLLSLLLLLVQSLLLPLGFIHDA